MLRAKHRSLILFALANAGGVVAYVPFLTLIFPARIDLVAGPSAIQWLGAATFAGAIAASVGNIAFGWLSDLVATRRNWALAGLLLTVGSYVSLCLATTFVETLAAIILYQLSLNMLLAPLTAWAADTVPDKQKGLLGGALAAGPPIGALVGVAATAPFLVHEWLQLALVCTVVVTLLAPLLLVAPSAAPSAERLGQSDPSPRGVSFALLWIARLIVQVAGAVLFSFLLIYFRSLPQPVTQSMVAVISATALTIAFPATILIGRLSDRWGSRKPFLIGAGAGAALGLLTMASDATAAAAVLGYAIFECSVTSFLALHTAYTMQVLPSPRRRGRDMGLLNLTNTLPSLIAPILTLWLVPRHGFPTLFTTLAALLGLAMVCLVLLPERPPLASRNLEH